MPPTTPRTASDQLSALASDLYDHAHVRSDPVCNDIAEQLQGIAGTLARSLSTSPSKPARTDAYRYSWESWHADGTIVVGLLDHTGDAEILLAVLRALDIKTLGGLPFNPPAETIRS